MVVVTGVWAKLIEYLSQFSRVHFPDSGSASEFVCAQFGFPASSEPGLVRLIFLILEKIGNFLQKGGTVPFYKTDLLILYLYNVLVVF
jgi:hypothetical protein